MIGVVGRLFSPTKHGGTFPFCAMSTESTGFGGYMKDKRKFERFEVKVPARIEIPGQNGRIVKFDLETGDLSAGGTFIKLEDPLPEGSEVKVEVVLSFEELITAMDPDGSLVLSTKGHVIRSTSDGIAIRFNENYEFKARLDFLHQEADKDTEPIS